MISIEVIYAEAGRQDSSRLTLPEDATLNEAIQRSGVLQRCPTIDLARNPVGIFGRVRTLDQVLADGDRVEIYRALRGDPKQIRRQRAKGAAKRS